LRSNDESFAAVLERLRAARRKPLFEVAFIATLAILLAVAVQAYAVKPYQIPSESMEPTLDIGQRVLVNRLSTRLGDDPDPGDIVVFHPPAGAAGAGQECEAQSDQRRGQVCPRAGSTPAEATFIKRVVAGPGDRLRIIDGIPIVNGHRFEGAWQIVPCQSCDFPTAMTIPDDEYFMMGDNRPTSNDSRFWGPVPRDWIIGKAVFTYWPPDRIGAL
jgi:signal peptidase I